MHFIFAYFGPEVQMPLASLLASVVGLLMVAGSAPLRVAKRLWGRLIPPSSARKASRD